MINLLNLFGLGKIKFSASISSLIAIILFLAIKNFDLAINILFFSITFITSLIIAFHNRQFLSKDPKEVVIDEFLGMYILLIIFNSSSMISIFILFFIFRILDIFKIWPISRLDKIKSWYGFILDDLFLGAIIGIIAKYSIIFL